MNVQSLRHWQWALVGLVAGAAVGAARLLGGSVDRLGGPGFVPQQKFEQMLRVPPAAGRPYIQRIRLRPVTGVDVNVDVVTLWVLTPKLTYEPTHFAAPRRYRPLGRPAPAASYSVRDYLAEMAKANPDLRVADAWWERPAPLLASHAVAGLVLVGGVWPIVLRRLVGAGYGRPEGEPYDLDRFHAGPDAVPSPRSISPEEQARLLALEEEMMKGLSTGGEPPAPAKEIAPDAPRRLEQVPTAAAPQAPDEDKDFFGEFYPVAHPHHHDDDAHAQSPSHAPPGHNGRSNGFTLVELLVVIGMITLLVSLLLPTVHVVRLQAQTVQCASQLRQIGMGFQMYVNNNGGWLPAWGGWATWPRGRAGDEEGPAWTEEMIPYLGDPDGPLYNCPSFPGPELRRNYFLAGQWSGRNGRHAMKLNEITMTSRFVLSGDKTQLALYEKPSGTGWNPDDSDPDDCGGNKVLAWPWEDGGFHMHRGGNNILFDDMHVALFADYDPNAMTFHPHRMLDWGEVTAE